MEQELNKIYNLLERIDHTFRDFSFINEWLILEAASLDDVYQKYYNQIPEDEFKQIVAADPTSGDDKMGKYSKWLLALYTNGNLKLEDLYKATQYLTTFHKYKNKLDKKDIGQYKSLPELFNSVSPYLDNTQAASHKEEIRQIKQDAEKVYEDDEWLVIVPHTEAAAIEYGKGTQWCTAATGSWNYFEDYNNEGFLYININKKTGRKYQFHFESQSFMDETDSSVDMYGIGLSSQLEKFYEDKYGLLTTGMLERRENTNYYIYFEVGKKHLVDLNGKWINDDGYDELDFVDESDGTSIVTNDGKKNVLDINGQLISPNMWFDNIEKSDLNDDWWLVTIYDYDNILDTWDVKSKSTYNLLKYDGTLVSPNKWLDYIGFFGKPGLFTFKIDEKANIMNENGEILSPDLWFKNIGWAYNDIAPVQLLNGKFAIFDYTIEKIISHEYERIGQFQTDVAKVFDGDKENIIWENGFLLSPDLWFDEVGTLYPKTISVTLNGKQNYISKRDGKILSPDLWFDRVSRFTDFHDFPYNYGRVSLNDKKNILLKDGRLLSDEWFDEIIHTNPKTGEFGGIRKINGGSEKGTSYKREFYQVTPTSIYKINEK